MNRLQSLRARAFAHQNERCYYCDLPIWEDDPHAFASRYGITIRQARAFQCTAEHLVARCDGGKTVSSNVVAACRHCNVTRHKRKRVLEPERWRIAQSRRALRRRPQPFPGSKTPVSRSAGT
jgi:5-methylcytosine-specific restriction endonuclease McrA